MRLRRAGRRCAHRVLQTSLVLLGVAAAVDDRQEVVIHNSCIGFRVCVEFLAHVPAGYRFVPGGCSSAFSSLWERVWFTWRVQLCAVGFPPGRSAHIARGAEGLVVPVVRRARSFRAHHARTHRVFGAAHGVEQRAFVGRHDAAQHVAAAAAARFAGFFDFRLETA